MRPGKFSVQKRLNRSHRNSELSLRRKWPEHPLDQRGIAVFLDLLDLAVLDAPDHAILIVVAKACLGDIVAAGFDHDIVAFRDEVERHGARPHGKERAEMAHQAVVDRIAPPEFMRPRILAGDDPGDILGDIVEMPKEITKIREQRELLSDLVDTISEINPLLRSIIRDQGKWDLDRLEERIRDVLRQDEE